MFIDSEHDTTFVMEVGEQLSLSHPLPNGWNISFSLASHSHGEKSRALDRPETIGPVSASKGLQKDDTSRCVGWAQFKTISIYNINTHC